MSHDQIEQVLTRLPGMRIGLLGDLFLDRYLDIEPSLDEPSIETGLTAYQVSQVRSYPGALGTILNNLAALGVGEIVVVSFFGEDGEGFELRTCLDRMPQVDCQGLVYWPGRRTPTYTKPMYGNRELNRLDIKNRTPTGSELETELVRRWQAVRDQCDAWIVLDQVSEADCGVITERVRQEINEYGSRLESKFVLADSRERIGLFQNVAIKPNRQECEKALAQLGRPADSTNLSAQLALAVNGPVFCTNADQGMELSIPEAGSCTSQAIPAYPVTGPIDVCGAGDSCSAGLTVAVVAGLPLPAAAAFGNLIASITVQKIGTTGTATPVEVRRRWQEIGG